MANRGLRKPRAHALAAELDICLDCGVCLACLSLVSSVLSEGTSAEIAGQLRSLTPHMWDEGLAEAALEAVRMAVAAGVHDADAALAELEKLGGRSGVARAIVRGLAVELTRRARVEKHVAELAHDRLALVPPEWN